METTNIIHKATKFIVGLIGALLGMALCLIPGLVAEKIFGSTSFVIQSAAMIATGIIIAAIGSYIVPRISSTKPYLAQFIDCLATGSLVIGLIIALIGAPFIIFSIAQT